MIRRRIRDEHGFTLIELMVGMVLAIMVLGGVVALLTTTARSSGRISERVAADQAARPNFQRLMDALHSTCVAPGIAPILPGSSDSSIAFIHQTGSEVSPTPVKRTVVLSGGSLIDTEYPATGGASPDWTFSTNPTSSFKLLDRVGALREGSPPVPVPLFRYYAYENGQISGQPLATPLSAGDAARAVLVNVAMAVAPEQSATSSEEGAPVELTDSALVRFSPSNEDTDQAGLPCT